MFDENFRVYFADSPFGVALHQRIRFQVFCLDKGFENPDDFSTARETDAWDDHSAHFIVQDASTRQWIAATRIVLPRRGQALPVEDIVKLDLAAPRVVDGPIGEISRFCVINSRSEIVKQTDSRPNGGLATSPNALEEWGIGAVKPRQQFEVTLGMIRAVVIYALKRDVEHCCVLITDAFARVLRKIGVILRQVGPTVDYRGMRTPYIIDLRASVLSMTKTSPAVRSLFRRSKRAYLRISSVAHDDTPDAVSEFAPDHSLFNETIFRDTVLLPAEDDSDLRLGTGPTASRSPPPTPTPRS